MKQLGIFTVILLSPMLILAKVPPTTYACVVKFNSQCCGVPNSSPILKYITSYKKKNKIKSITYYLISPMGREGEYYMVFSLNELNKTQKDLFTKQIGYTAKSMKDKGSCTTEQQMVIDKESLSSQTTITKKTI